LDWAKGNNSLNQRPRSASVGRVGPSGVRVFLSLSDRAWPGGGGRVMGRFSGEVGTLTPLGEAGKNNDLLIAVC
jgi:hypothetical protein